MKRYDPIAIMDWGEGYGGMEEDSLGDYVLYEDAQAEVDRLRAALEHIDAECAGDVSPGYIQEIARRLLREPTEPTPRPA